MRICILTFDSRGNIQPLIPLGHKLQQRGFSIRFVAHARFESLIQDNGLEFASIPDLPRDAETGPDEVASLGTKLRFAKNMALSLVGAPQDGDKRINKWTDYQNSVFDAYWDVCQDADAIILTLTSLWGMMFAEKLNVPSFTTGIFPTTPTKEFPHFITSYLHPNRVRWGATLNRFSYSIIERAGWSYFLRMARRTGIRERLELPALPKKSRDYKPLHSTPMLYGISPSVLPRPDDWPQNHYMTGYWYLDRPPGWEPPQDLLDFLAAGAPPRLHWIREHAECRYGETDNTRSSSAHSIRSARDPVDGVGRAERMRTRQRYLRRERTAARVAVRQDRRSGTPRRRRDNCCGNTRWFPFNCYSLDGRSAFLGKTSV